MSQISFLTNELLKQTMTGAVADRGETADADLCIDSGIWKCSPSTLNVPKSNWCLLISFRISDITFQIFVNFLSGFGVYVRALWANGKSKSDWHQLTASAV